MESYREKGVNCRIFCENCSIIIATNIKDEAMTAKLIIEFEKKPMLNNDSFGDRIL